VTVPAHAEDGAGGVQTLARRVGLRAGVAVVPAQRTARRANTVSAAASVAAAEVTPLSQRAGVMMIFRVAVAAVLTVLAMVTRADLPIPAPALALAYLAAVAALSLGVLVPHRPWAPPAVG
jgi:hypothetical protein